MRLMILSRILPIQKGALIVWLMTMLTGLGVSEAFEVTRFLLFFTGTFSALAAYRSLEDYVKFKKNPKYASSSLLQFFVALLFSSAMLFILIYGGRLLYLIPMGIIAFAIIIFSIFMQYKLRSRVLHEYVGIIGLTMIAPAYYYTMTESLGLTPLILWIILTLYHIPTNNYIRIHLKNLKAKLTVPTLKNPEESSGPVDGISRALILQFTVSLSLIVILVVFGFIPPLMIVAFSIFPIRTIKEKDRNYSSGVVRTGIRESVILAIFTLIVVISYRFEGL